MPDHDYVTGAEFSRWMGEEQEFRARLERRMADNAGAVQTGLDRIETHLAEINGRTRKNSEDIAAATVRLARIEREDDAIEDVVRAIRDHGCSQLEHHAVVMQTLQGGPTATALPHPRDWSPRAKVAAGAGVTVALWPALTEIAKLLYTLIRWIEASGGR